MRLLEVESFQFKEFNEGRAPKYAILSHCWVQDEEISFTEMHEATKEGKISANAAIWGKTGFVKIRRFCELALKTGYQYGWVDTCCIDKTSSAELQESINSMFRWYAESDVCYAYLSDVVLPDEPNSLFDPTGGMTVRSCVDAFRASRWFKRGWTLQELIAPLDMAFFDRSWKPIRRRKDIPGLLQEITGIERQIFYLRPRRREVHSWKIGIGEKMCWAAGRATTRKEDEAYALMGLFEINMPLIYGEARRAFQRLQEEIIKVDEDLSLLAWCGLDGNDPRFPRNGLATKTAHFRNFKDLIAGTKAEFGQETMAMTPRGLQVTLPVKKDINHDGVAYALLATGERENVRVSLLLPLVFPGLRGDRTWKPNQCLRLSNPIWVDQSFASTTEREMLCFSRNVETVDPYCFGGGFTLSATVRKQYVETFTYPPQPDLQYYKPRLFPNNFANNDKSPRMTIFQLHDHERFTRQYVIILQYQSINWSIPKPAIESFSVKVTWLPFDMTLPCAESIANGDISVDDLPNYNLFDTKGNIISPDAIVEYNRALTY